VRFSVSIPGSNFNVFCQSNRCPLCPDPEDSNKLREGIISASAWGNQKVQIVKFHSSSIVLDRDHFTIYIQIERNCEWRTFLVQQPLIQRVVDQFAQGCFEVVVADDRSKQSFLRRTINGLDWSFVVSHMRFWRQGRLALRLHVRS
jgi:hypothetical protein